MGTSRLEPSGRPAGASVAVEPRPAAARGDTLARWIFLLAALVFSAASARLSAVNWSVGSFDSVQNLVVARNIAEGRGFTNGSVTQHTLVEKIPGPEIVRPPGAPYAGALAFRLLGEGTYATTLLSALLVLATALAVRAAVRMVGAGWLGDAAGALVLLAHGSYELVSFWDNGLLTFLTALALVLAVASARGRLRGAALAGAGALVGVAGYLTKPTFVLSVVPLMGILLLSEPDSNRRTRLRNLALFGGLMVVVSAPYWVRNIIDWGTPSVLPAPRLAIHYGLVSPWLAAGGVFYGHPLSMQDVLARIGWSGVFRAEAVGLRATLDSLVRLSLPVFLVAAAGLVLLRRRDLRLALAALCLLIGPLFDCLYMHPEPRYLWPALPPLVLLAAVGGRALFDAATRRLSVRAARPVGALVVASCLLAALPACVGGWHRDFATALTPPPPWTEAVSALPPDARVFAWNAPEVAWFARRQAVIVPLGTRAQVLEAVSAYHPTDFLVEDAWFQRAVASTQRILADRLHLLAHGEGWQLYRIEPSGAAAPAGG